MTHSHHLQLREQGEIYLLVDYSILADLDKTYKHREKRTPVVFTSSRHLEMVTSG
jgi:hypothetical protein